MSLDEMYYDRTITKELEQAFTQTSLSWLYDFVKKQDDLDFLIGKNNKEQWISVYRGLSRVIKFSLPIKKINVEKIKVSAANTYINLAKKNEIPLYDQKTSLETLHADFTKMLKVIRGEAAKKNSTLHRTFDNRKEGYFQNKFSRSYGIECKMNSEFVIVDKEAVIGYEVAAADDSLNEKRDKKLRPKDIRNEKLGILTSGFKEIIDYLAKEKNSKKKLKYGKSIANKNLGNEIDFIGVNKNGDILLIEFKNSEPASGVYLSPLQIGLYARILNSINEGLKISLKNMIDQKARMGLIPKEWSKINMTGEIIPWIIISNYNPNSSGKRRLDEVCTQCRTILDDKRFLNKLEVFSFNDSGILARI